MIINCPVCSGSGSYNGLACSGCNGESKLNIETDEDRLKRIRILIKKSSTILSEDASWLLLIIDYQQKILDERLDSNNK